jgi:hypothetical protein
MQIKYIFSIPKLVVFFIKPKTYQPLPRMSEKTFFFSLVPLSMETEASL